MDLSTIWELTKTLGPGGAVLCLLLWLDERRERRQIQQHVTKLHRENIRLLERLLRKVDHVLAARATNTARLGNSKRRG